MSISKKKNPPCGGWEDGKPGSVFCARRHKITVIYLGRLSPDASSGHPAGRWGGQPLADCRTLHRMGFTSTLGLLRVWCALTAPFHPDCHRLRRVPFRTSRSALRGRRSGLVSVALSVDFAPLPFGGWSARRPAVSVASCPVVPGLSSRGCARPCLFPKPYFT